MKKVSRKIVLLVALTSISVLGGITLTLKNVRADNDTSIKTIILEKAAFYGLKQCYIDNKQIKESIYIDDYRDGASIVKLSGATTYPLPTGFTGAGSVNCSDLLNGKSSYGGLYGIATASGQTTPATIPPNRSNTEEVRQYLNGMGYTGEVDPDEGKCTKYIWNVTYSGQTAGYSDGQSWVQMCAVLKDGKFASDDSLSIRYFGTVAKIVQFETSKGKLQLDCELNWPTYGGCTDHTYKKGDSYTEFRTSVLADLSKNLGSKSVAVAPGVTGNFTIQTPEDGQYDAADNEFTISDNVDAFTKALKFLSNNRYSNLSTLRLNQNEEATLLLSYLYDYYAVEVSTTDSDSCNISGDKLTIAKNNGAKQARIYRNGKFESCYVRPTKNSDNTVPAYDANQGATKDYFTGVRIGFGDIVSRLNGFTISTLPDGALSEPATSGGASGDTASSDDDYIESPCTLAGGPLSWILCPALSVMGAAIEGLYGWIEDQFLNTSASLYSNESGTYDAWKTFQTYANIFFIILLVFVILSQVTGFGISNYGIKKTLPKLIIAIILINISFFICQIAVDLSNIIGNSIKETFDGLAGDMSTRNLGTSVGAIVSYVVGGGEITGLAIGAISIAKLIPGTFETWMIPFVLAMVACVLGVIFFFIILCVRQAAIVVLIILAPLAVAAYALPNTKKLFDRWLKVFTALLLVYPICGLLMGGGNFVSRLLIEGAADGDSGFGMILVALLANVVPFFFIPSILRSSMAGLGNLGAKISGFGDRLNRGIGRAFRTSEMAKDMQRKATMRNADYLKARMDRKYGGKSREDMTDKERRRYDRDHRRFVKAETANQRAIYEEASIAANDGRHISLGDEEFNRIVAGKQMAQLEQDTKDQQSAYEMDDDFDTGDPKVTGAEFKKVLTDFSNDPSDRTNLLKMRALANILAKDDPGRSQLRNVLYGARANGRESGLDVAAQYLLANHGQVIKNEDRGFHTALTEFASKNFSQPPSSFVARTTPNKKGEMETHYSSDYDTMKSDSWSDDTWSKAGSAAYQGVEDGIRYGTIDENVKNGFVDRSINVTGNERLSGTKGGDAGAQGRIIARGANGKQLASMNARSMKNMVTELNKNENSELRQEFLTRSRSMLTDSNNHFDAKALDELSKLKGINTADIAQARRGDSGRFSGGGRVDHSRNNGQGTGDNTGNTTGGGNTGGTSRNFGGRVTNDQGFNLNAPNGTLTDSGIYIPDAPQRRQSSQNNNNSGQ